VQVLQGARFVQIVTQTCQASEDLVSKLGWCDEDDVRKIHSRPLKILSFFTHTVRWPMSPKGLF